MCVILLIWLGHVSAAQITQWKAEIKWYMICMRHINSLVWYHWVVTCGCDRMESAESERLSLGSRPRTNACVLRIWGSLSPFGKFLTSNSESKKYSRCEGILNDLWLRSQIWCLPLNILLQTYSTYVWGKELAELFLREVWSNSESLQLIQNA